MDVRVLTSEDRERVLQLLGAIPPGEYLFVKRSLADPDATRAWVVETEGWWVGAFRDGHLLGVAVVVPGSGWSSHVGEIRMVVAPEHRRAGVGAVLARAALRAAIEHGCQVVRVEAIAEQAGVHRIFTSLGFTPEALLPDHVREPGGRLHDLVVLLHMLPAAAATDALIGAHDS